MYRRLQSVSVVIAEGRHPVPYRTRKLSPSAPMVLPGKLGGRVGRRRDTSRSAAPEAALRRSRAWACAPGRVPARCAPWRTTKRSRTVPGAPPRRPARGAGGRNPANPRSRSQPGRSPGGAGAPSERSGRPRSGGAPAAGRGGGSGDRRPRSGDRRPESRDRRPDDRRLAPSDRRQDERAVEEGPGVSEILPAEALAELRETARPYAVADAARALADAVVALSEDGDPEAAVKSARVAKRAAPRAASVREALGVALYQVGDFGGARTELAAAQRISGRQDLAAMLADIERALGRPERAIALFERVDRSKLEPDTAAELLLVTASAYGDLGQPASGVALIRRHARWPTELADHHLRLGLRRGRPGRAGRRPAPGPGRLHPRRPGRPRLPRRGRPPGPAHARVAGGSAPTRRTGPGVAGSSGGGRRRWTGSC